jgi:hypothetical protein
MNSTNFLDQLMSPFFNVATDISIFWFIVKIFFIVGFMLYVLFSILIVRQVVMMTNTFRTSAEWVLKILSFVHLFFAVAVLVASFVVL